MFSIFEKYVLDVPVCETVKRFLSLEILTSPSCTYVWRAGTKIMHVKQEQNVQQIYTFIFILCHGG